jgi:hypothetical protein
VIPVGAIIGAIAVARILAERKSGGGSSGPRQKTRAAVLVWVLLGWWVVLMAFVGVLSRAWGMVVPLVIFSPVLFPSLLTRYLLVPLGLARTSYFVILASDVVWHLDRRGGAVLCGAWALQRRKKPSAKAIEWLEARLAKQTPLRGGGIVAGGLLAAARADLDGARAVLASVDTIDAKAAPPAARRIAAEWRIADAIARGDWALAEHIGTDLGPRTGATRFLGVVAERLRASVVPRSDAQLVWRWLFSRERLELLPLLRRARDAVHIVDGEHDVAAAPRRGARRQRPRARAAPARDAARRRSLDAAGGRPPRPRRSVGRRAQRSRDPPLRRRACVRPRRPER